jgi:2-polyprenyl-6-methoxyphenol hydroxylase-like FAD-dependent oxidoreductase
VKDSNPVDTLIIGAGLTGLLLAHRLRQAEIPLALYESKEILGGSFRRQSVTQPYSSPVLDFLPATGVQLELMEWLKSIAPTPLHVEVLDHKPLLFDEGKWRPFVGFGETEFKSVGEIAFAGHAQELRLIPPLEQLVRALVDQLPISAHTNQEVTRIRVQDGQVTGVVINEEKTVTANRYIFTGQPSHLNNLIDGEGLSSKSRSRLARPHSWTAVVVELKHKLSLDSDTAVRIFNHSAKEFEPVLGRVFGTNSQWMTLVPEENSQDHEFVSQCIRHIKRQLKRPWPNAFDDIVEEKIYVHHGAFGFHPLKGKDPLQVPEISNLYLAGHALSDSPGPLGHLHMARQVEIEFVGTLNRLPELGASC